MTTARGVTKIVPPTSHKEIRRTARGGIVHSYRQPWEVVFIIMRDGRQYYIISHASIQNGNQQKLGTRNGKQTTRKQTKQNSRGPQWQRSWHRGWTERMDQFHVAPSDRPTEDILMRAQKWFWEVCSEISPRCGKWIYWYGRCGVRVYCLKLYGNMIWCPNSA